MEDKTEILSVDNLKIQFKNQDDITTAVKGLSFSLFAGETLGIVGESGSGKSVTALSLMKLLDEPPALYASGSIRLKVNEKKDPLDILGLPYTELLKIRGSQIAMIFQNPMNSLNPSHRCGDQVTEAILLHNKVSKEKAKQEVLDLFEKVDLQDPERIFKAYPHQLSGGQIQRIMIAMAVSCKPRILIADEPTTALDVTVQKSIISLLKDIKEKYDTSVIFISHDLGVVNEIADRVLVMLKGEIVEHGTTEEIFRNPQHPYTKGLIACRPSLNRRLYKLPTIQDFQDGSSFVSKEFTKAAYQERLATLSNNEILLDVKGLSKHFVKSKNFFGKPKTFTKAVDEVSFSLTKGMTLGLVGESGSGKSTLGKTILKLIPATAGKVVFDGKSVFDLDRKSLKDLRKDFQIIFQNPYASLNPRLKIGEAILEPMKVHNTFENRNLRKQRTIELLETVGLEADHFERYPHQFSGGQRQRICIARTLSLEPKFIVCDECVSALDVSVQAQILNLLTSLREQFDLSYIFISHDLSVVKHIADRLLVMKDGKIVESNDAESIYQNPEHPYTQRLLEAIPKGLEHSL